MDNINSRREFIRKSLVATTGISVIPFQTGKGIGKSIQSTRQKLPIVENNRSNYVVILNSGASASEHYAANKLVQYIRDSTGISLPVKEGVNGISGSDKMIILGCGDVSRSLGIKPDPEVLGEQGFLIETVKNSLVIAGTRGAGTLYGIYHFLENYIGIRWYTPDVTKVPSLSHIYVPVTKQVITPSFLYRETYYTWPGRNRDFLTRIRINSGGRNEKSKYGLGYGFHGMAHSYFNFVSPDEFFDTHPEYFSEIGGKRIRNETQLCLTNPEVFEIVSERMLAVMRSNPDLRQYNFSQMDYYNGCQCEKCREFNEKYKSGGATQFSFVNRLAERTAKEFPDKLIGTLAYTYTEAVPEGMEIHPNVAVWLCHMLPCCDSHSIESCEKNAGYKQRALVWSKRCKHLYIWHYIVDFAHYYNPFPNLWAMAADMRFYKEIGVEGIFAQGIGDDGGGGEFSLLRGYYCAKLMWDVNQDSNNLLKDFLKGYYGKAWEQLWKYINLLHDQVEDKDIHLHLYSNPAYGHLSDNMITQANQLFDEAESMVAKNNVLLDRVRVARMPLCYASLFPRNGYRIEKDRLVFNGKIGGKDEVEGFLRMMEEHGFKSIREGYSDPSQLIKMSMMFAYGLKVVTLNNEFLSIDIIPALAGRILSIIDKNTGQCITARNKVRSMWFPFTGGQENRVGGIYSTWGWTEPAEVVNQTDNSVTTKARLGNGLILERKLSLAKNAGEIHITSSLSNPGIEIIDAHLRSHLELELENLGSVQVSFQNKSGDYVNSGVNEIISGAREGIYYYQNEAPLGQWSFRSEKLEIVQSFNSNQVEFVKLYSYPEDLKELELELWLTNQPLKDGNKIVFNETIEVKS